VCPVWVPCVAFPSGGGSSVGPSPLCGSPVWVPCVGLLGPLCVDPLCGSPVWVPCVGPSAHALRHVASTHVMSPARSHAPALFIYGCHHMAKVRIVSYLSLHKILFHSKALLLESIILFLPPPHLQSLPYCNTIARPLRNIRAPADLPLLCHIPYNISDDNIV